MTKPCPLVDIEGGPCERGVMYGRKAADRVALSVAHYREQLDRMGLAWPRVCGLVRDYLPRIEAYGPDYVEEMRGIARGAGIESEAIVLLNARTEILELAARGGALGATKPVDPEGCTGVVVLPEAAAAGRVIHAQNWDWKAECADTAIVLRIARRDGPNILTFTEAGGLARSGLNAAGIAITANYLESDRDYQRLGVPLALIRRRILEQEHLALAMRAVYVTPKSGSNNVMMSHAGGVALDFECAPDETFLVHPAAGLLVHANHWQSPVALAKLRDTGIAGTPDSLYRDMRVAGLLGPRRGRIDVSAVKAALFDDFGTPWSVCRPPSQGVEGNLAATVAMIVMEPQRLAMEVCMMPALGREFGSYGLERSPARNGRGARRAR